MKKSASLFFSLITILLCSAFARAEDLEPQNYPPQDDSSQQRGYERGGRMDRMNDERGGRMMGSGPQGMMGGKNMGMHGMMGGPKQTVVATSDGGVVILSGKTLAKYDARLNLINTIELQDKEKPKEMPPREPAFGREQESVPVPRERAAAAGEPAAAAEPPADLLPEAAPIDAPSESANT